jgi:hypothetical protein
MRLAVIFIYVFFIGATGQTAQTAISDDILYDDINSLYGWDNPELFNDDCRNTQQTASDSYSVTASGYLFDDCLFNMQPETALLTYDQGGAKGFDYFDDKWTKLAGIGYHSMYAGAEIFATDSGRDNELANNPSLSNIHYDDVVSWIEDAYHAWVAKDHYGSTRLLLLSFGLVGLIGIRRKFKKN